MSTEAGPPATGGEVDAETAARLARNEAAFRQVNEALEAGARGDDAVFVCECATLGCNATVRLSLAEYEALRTDFVRFLVLPGHQDVVDRVVEDHGSYLVVEKVGHAVPVARATDPRAGSR